MNYSKEIIVGSSAFFGDFEDFIPDDEDTLILVDNPTDFNIHQQIRLNGNCIFKWKRMTSDEFINYHKDLDLGLLLGKFLVPEFIEEIGLTINQLKELELLSTKLDKRHLYEKVIYDSYIENGDFILNDAQKLKAYNLYKKHKTIV